MNQLFLACIHDRHTEDKFKLFTTEKAAQDYLLAKNWPGIEPSTEYGDWSLVLSDDYYMFVQKVEVVS